MISTNKISLLNMVESRDSKQHFLDVIKGLNLLHTKRITLFYTTLINNSNHDFFMEIMISIDFEGVCKIVCLQ